MYLKIIKNDKLSYSCPKDKVTIGKTYKTINTGTNPQYFWYITNDKNELWEINKREEGILYEIISEIIPGVGV